MALLNLTPEGKYKLSRNVRFQQTVLQAAAEKARDLVAANNASPPSPFNVAQAKRDAYARQILKSGIGGNKEGLILSFLTRFDNSAVQLDPDDFETNLALIYDPTADPPVDLLTEWFDLQAGVLPGDAAKNANYPPGSQYDV